MHIKLFFYSLVMFFGYGNKVSFD